jgi:Fuc2NAc and GlcNAc transferase
VVPSALYAAAFLATLVGTEWLRRLAWTRALLDRPNERSLHSAPTPRLGGVAVVLSTLVVAALCAIHGSSELRVVLAFGAVVAALGFADDMRPLPAGIRLLLQCTAAGGFLWVLGAPEITIASETVLTLPHWVQSAALLLWLVGTLNIYNFMDGMDGLAAVQAIGAAVGQGALLALGGAEDMARLVAIVGAASAGFLAHNFPPARIFLGDTGSTFLGFVFGALAIVGMRHGVAISATALPLAPFLLDGTFTILRRVTRREPVWKAHRSHLYQRAVQTGLGHREVLLVYAAWAALAVIATAFAPIAGWCAVTIMLVGVWCWVARRELEKASAA